MNGVAKFVSATARAICADAVIVYGAYSGTAAATAAGMIIDTGDIEVIDTAAYPGRFKIMRSTKISTGRDIAK